MLFIIGQRSSFMDLSLIQEDLYPHKLATILGRGQRLKRILRKYPTEKRFKAATLEDIGEVIGIKNLKSKIMQQLASFDKTYNELITLRYDSTLSNAPEATNIMGIDTEYLLSPLDSIQFVIYQNYSLYSGIIFTNSRLAFAVTPEEGILFLREIIAEFNPDIIVGHNFNCDITVLERIYQDKIPELHNYDDTMMMARQSHVANIIGSAALKKLTQKIFSIKSLEIYQAYRNLTSFAEYGVLDALLPIYLRYFFMTGEKKEIVLPEKIDYIVLSKNKIQLKYKKINFPVV